MLNKILSKQLLLLFITFLKLCDAVDTLSQTEALGYEQTLVSPNQVYEVGFFTPGASANSFFGIWFRTAPKAVVWVANRNDPVIDSRGVEFSISGNGSLAVSRNGSMIWSSSPSVVAANPVLRLLDTGNLVLVENTTTDDKYIWQSFDFPTDSWLPGMRLVDDSDAGVEKYLQSWRNSDDPSPGEFVYRIENEGLPELVLLRDGKKLFRTGAWNGFIFGGMPPMPNGTVVDHAFRGEKLIYLARPVFSSAFSRLTLEPSGLLQRYNLNARRDKWNAVIEYPRDKCDEYGNCGQNALCSTEKTQVCECFRGFSPKSSNDWSGQDWSRGCERIAPFNCEDGDGFVEVRGVKYPDMLRYRLNSSMNLQECRDECFKNCSCTAYANPYVINGGSGCLMWYGDLLDARELSAADTLQNIYIRVPVSELGSIINGEEERRKGGAKKLMAIFVASGVLILALFVGGLLFIVRRKRQALNSKNEDIELKIFKLETIVAATHNFSEENMIGEGGFGPVFKGNLYAEGEIAVKRLSRSSQQGIEEFKNEVTLIAKLQHRNLVRLLGCCIDGEERMLIYEYRKRTRDDIEDRRRRRLPYEKWRAPAARHQLPLAPNLAIQLKIEFESQIELS